MGPFDGCSPEIDYPCRWKYQIVGTSEEAIRSHVAALLGSLEHDLVFARHSSGGKYVSLHLTLIVSDETQRLAIGEQLAAHDAIRMVF